MQHWVLFIGFRIRIVFPCNKCRVGFDRICFHVSTLQEPNKLPSFVGEDLWRCRYLTVSYRSLYAVIYTQTKTTPFFFSSCCLRDSRGRRGKTPAFIPSYNCIPHHQLFDEASSTDLPDYFSTVQNSSEVEASSINSLTEQNSKLETSSKGLPDYFSVVQNIDQVYSDADLQICTHNVPETPPPCYEDAMATMAATLKDVGANFEKGNTRDI